jgi:hypothetical protein
MESERKIENHEFSENSQSDNTKATNLTNGGQMTHNGDKENENPNLEKAENKIRRHDEPSELSFEICE